MHNINRLGLAPWTACYTYEPEYTQPSTWSCMPSDTICRVWDLIAGNIKGLQQKLHASFTVIFNYTFEQYWYSVACIPQGTSTDISLNSKRENARFLLEVDRRSITSAGDCMMVCTAWAHNATVPWEDFVLYSLTAKGDWTPAKCKVSGLNSIQSNVARCWIFCWSRKSNSIGGSVQHLLYRDKIVGLTN